MKRIRFTWFAGVLHLALPFTHKINKLFLASQDVSFAHHP